ncbi:MAG TPA: DNA repair exonuclease [Gemmatimonadaceae bacterium]|nr:DNA repair exonuclease [Gemmatimonadaceae bacterium]
MSAADAMRLVHLADLHLGKRQFERTTARGLNVRELDVAQTFRRHVDAILALAPDIVVVAGDCFDTVRPSNVTLDFALQQFARLTAAVPHVIVAAGNHEMPRTAGTGSPVRLLRTVGVLVAEQPERFQCGRCRVFAVPDNRAAYPELLPVRDGDAEFDVLVLHAALRGTIPGDVVVQREMLGAEDLFAEAWDYIALGDYHQQAEIYPNAWYSGAIDYTSSNPWAEIGTPKGFRVVDLATEEQVFVPIEPMRRYIDLPALSAHGLSAAELDAAIAQRVTDCPGGIDGAVVRLVVTDCDPVLGRSLDHAALREYEKRALHFRFDRRVPQRVGVRASLSPGQRPSLTSRVSEYIDRIEAPDVNKGDLLALALSYLERAGEDAADVERVYAMVGVA